MRCSIGSCLEVALKRLIRQIVTPIVASFGLITPSVAQERGPRDSAAAALASARTLIDSGFAWRASLILDPVVRSPFQNSPAAELLAAESAAGWEGWSRVRSLLEGKSWLGSDSSGTGYHLLALAALHQGRDSLAAWAASLAYAQSDSASSAPRQLLLAQALERQELFDSASTLYLNASRTLRPIGNWILLRAAGVQRDSAQRQQIYNSLTNPVARDYVGSTEASIRTRLRDYLGAARQYRQLSDPVRAIEAQLKADIPPTQRVILREELFGLLSPNGSASRARTAIQVVDRFFSDLTADEELLIGRRADEVGLLGRSATGYERARRLLTGRDMYRYGTVLVRLGREARAIPILAVVRDPAYRGRAMYQRARAILRAGAGGRSMEALQDVIQDYPQDTDAASSALYLSADLYTDRGEDSIARTFFRRVAEEYPTSRFADQAQFRAALLGFVLGDHLAAAREFDALVRTQPNGSEREAALWWSGRSYATAGDSTTALQRWRQLARARTGGYYVTLAAERVEIPPWQVPPDDFLSSDPTSDTILTRAALLERLGLSPEADLERRALQSRPGTSVGRILSTAVSFSQAGFPAIAARLASRARAQGAPETTALFRLLYPLPFREIVERESARFGLDPHLVSALIRQESAFDPHARSIADARGLMQVLPSVGATMARGLRLPDWDPVMLDQPDVNIAFGLQHLREALERYGNQEATLAAYNAGSHRVDRWKAKAGASDPQLFVERIPFVETRGYVRRIAQNLVIYRMLYASPLNAVTPTDLPNVRRPVR